MTEDIPGRHEDYPHSVRCRESKKAQGTQVGEDCVRALSLLSEIKFKIFQSVLQNSCSLPVHYFIDDIVLFAAGTAQIDPRCLNVAVSEEIR